MMVFYNHSMVKLKNKVGDDMSKSCTLGENSTICFKVFCFYKVSLVQMQFFFFSVGSRAVGK